MDEPLVRRCSIRLGSHCDAPAPGEALLGGRRRSIVPRERQTPSDFGDFRSARGGNSTLAPCQSRERGKPAVVIELDRGPVAIRCPRRSPTRGFAGMIQDRDLASTAPRVSSNFAAIDQANFPITPAGWK